MRCSRTSDNISFALLHLIVLHGGRKLCGVRMVWYFNRGWSSKVPSEMRWVETMRCSRASDYLPLTLTLTRCNWPLARTSKYCNWYFSHMILCRSFYVVFLVLVLKTTPQYKIFPMSFHGLLVLYFHIYFMRNPFGSVKCGWSTASMP